MQWPGLNSIILPLFISESMPVERERDTTLSLAHQKVIEYCKDTLLAKQKDSSYICRLQIESDCKDLQKEKACDLLAKLRDWEQAAREKHLVAKEKRKDTMFWCVVAPPRISPPDDTGYRPVPVRRPGLIQAGIKIKAGSFNMDDDLSWSKKYSLGIQGKMAELIRLGDKIRQSQLPASCSSDTECKVHGMGHKGCGGYVGSIYYSGSPSVIADIRDFNRRDKELNELLQFPSTCEYHDLFEPICVLNVCKPSRKRIEEVPVF